MKKTILTLTAIIFICSNGWATNRLAWNDEQATMWQQMKQENHKYYQRLKEMADGAVYEDLGIADGVMFNITGDSVYAQRAFDHIKHWETKVPSRDDTRHQFITLAQLYSWIADALPAQDKATFKQILFKVADLAVDPSHDTRTGDSDELTGHYFGMVLTALAIRDEDQSKSDELLIRAGGVDSTGNNRETWRNTLFNYSTKAQGGQWLESTTYNIGTLTYLSQGIRAINDFYGENKFPEYDLNDFAQSQIAELTSNLNETFMWGDNESVRGISTYRRMPLVSTLAGITKNPQALWLFDQLYDKHGTTGLPPHWILYADAYSQREPMADTDYNAWGMGVVTSRIGSKLFGSIFKLQPGVDHNMNGFSNFELYDNGWIITVSRGYYSGPFTEANYLNTLLINGGLPGYEQEYRQQIDFKSTDTYVYHAGTAKGRAVRADYWDPPETVLDEWTRQVVFLKHVPAIVVFDRVDSENPIDLPKFHRYPEKTKSMIEKSNGRHVFLLNVNEDPQTNENAYAWTTAPGRQAKLTAFFDHTPEVITTIESINPDSATAEPFGGYMRLEESMKQIRLTSASDDDWQTLLSVITFDGKDAVEVTDGDYRGVQIGSNKVLFNAKRDIVPEVIIDGEAPPVDSDPVEPEPEEEEEETEPETCPECLECEECQDCEECQACPDPEPEPDCEDVVDNKTYINNHQKQCHEAVMNGCKCQYWHGTYKKMFEIREVSTGD